MNSVLTLTDTVENDSRAVCIFCMSEIPSAYENFGIHCGEAGAVMSRAEYIRYTGNDYFAD